MIPILIFSFLATATLLSILSPFASQLRLLDYPGGRKKHQRPVPVIGGICLFITLTAVLILSSHHDAIYRNFEVAIICLIVIGILDDKHSLPARSRFIAQFLAALIVSVLGNSAISYLGNLLGTGYIYLTWWCSIPFTCFALIGTINAVNMMDGLDGLTGCVSIIELAFLFGLAYIKGLTGESVIILSLIGGLFAYLLVNFPSQFSHKYKIFLGDAGSMLIGFTLGWCAISLSKQGYYPPVLMLWIVALPLMDATRLIINRCKRGVSPFKADRRHIHHILLELGFSPRKTVLSISVLSLLFGIVGLSLYWFGMPEWLMFYSFIILFAIYTWAVYKLKRNILKNKKKVFAQSIKS